MIMCNNWQYLWQMIALIRKSYLQLIQQAWWITVTADVPLCACGLWSKWELRWRDFVEWQLQKHTPTPFIEESRWQKLRVLLLKMSCMTKACFKTLIRLFKMWSQGHTQCKCQRSYVLYRFVQGKCDDACCLICGDNEACMLQFCKCIDFSRVRQILCYFFMYRPQTPAIVSWPI